MPGKCEGPRWLGNDSNHKLQRWSDRHLGGQDMVRRVDQNVRGLRVVQLGVRAMHGAAWSRNLMNRCEARKVGHTMNTEKC